MSLCLKCGTFLVFPFIVIFISFVLIYSPETVLNNASEPVQYLNIMKTDKAQRKYAVISTSTPESDANKPWKQVGHYHYVFYVPLTVLVWRRIGYETIVLISGKEKEWLEDSCLAVVFKFLTLVQAHVIFLNPPSSHRVMLSQTSRLFVASLYSWGLRDDDYLVTSDVDLWPFNSSSYHLPDDKSLILQHYNCCGTFKYGNNEYTMVHMINIGAKVKTWRDIVTINGRTLPKTPGEVVKYYLNDFGTVINSPPIRTGGYVPWYLDQRMISILVKEWGDKYGESNILKVPTNTKNDRIDRGSWRDEPTLAGKRDAHLLSNGEEHWLENLHLLKLLFDSKTSDGQRALNISVSYWSEFQQQKQLQTNKKT